METFGFIVTVYLVIGLVIAIGLWLTKEMRSGSRRSSFRQDFIPVTIILVALWPYVLWLIAGHIRCYFAQPKPPNRTV